MSLKVSVSLVIMLKLGENAQLPITFRDHSYKSTEQ